MKKIGNRTMGYSYQIDATDILVIVAIIGVVGFFLNVFGVI